MKIDNRSLYVQYLQSKGVCMESLWQESLGALENKRIQDDALELDFWEDYCHHYDAVPSLYDYAPQVLDKIIQIIGTKKNVLEIGCGTGKFTVPLSLSQNSILALDQSGGMLAKLREKIEKQKINNIKPEEGRIESFETSKKDVVLGINSHYRIKDMHGFFSRINQLANERCLIVWTQQRSPYDEILNRTEVKGLERKTEYIHLINILYDLGIDANLEILDVDKPVQVRDLNLAFGELSALSQKYSLSYYQLKRNFEKRVHSRGNEVIFIERQKVAFIYFDAFSV